MMMIDHLNDDDSNESNEIKQKNQTIWIVKNIFLCCLIETPALTHLFNAKINPWILTPQILIRQIYLIINKIINQSDYCFNLNFKTVKIIKLRWTQLTTEKLYV